MIALDIDVLIMSKASPIQVRHYECPIFGHEESAYSWGRKEADPSLCS